MADLSAEAQFFNENGFVALRNVFSDAEITAVSDEINRVINGEATYVPDHDLVYEPDSNPKRVRNAFRLHQYNPFFMSVARNPKVIPIIEEIFEKPIRLYGSQLFAKPASVGTAVPLHQDMPYWPFAPYEMLSCWIALDDSTIENGCVRYLKGSHKLGIMNHVPSGVPGNSLGLSDPKVEGLEEIAVPVPRGSCILHHCLTAHHSEPNRSGQARRGLIYVYMSKNVQLTDASKL